MTAHEIQALARAVPARYGALVLVLAFGGLRFGEVTALHRCDVSPDGSTVTVARSVRYVGGRWLVGPPKTDAGIRTVVLPAGLASSTWSRPTASSRPSSTPQSPTSYSSMDPERHFPSAQIGGQSEPC